MSFKTPLIPALSAVSRPGLDQAWTNPGFAASADGSYATVETSASENRSNWLDVYFNAPSIDSSATIIKYELITGGYGDGIGSSTLDISSTAGAGGFNGNCDLSPTSANVKTTASISDQSVLDSGQIKISYRINSSTSALANIDSIRLQATYSFGSALNYAGGGASVGGALHAWQDPQEVTAHDGTYSSIALGNTASDNDYLHSTEFGFAIPSSSTILGIKADFFINTSASSSWIGNTVQLIKNGIRSGDNKGTGGGTSPINEYKSYGDSTDLWGLSLTPSDINASNFGLALRFENFFGGVTGVNIDDVRITVYYDGPGQQGIDSVELGNELSTVGLTQEHEISVNNLEVGFNNSIPTAFSHLPENRYGFGIDNVTISKNIVPQTLEYGTEISFVNYSQLHVLGVTNYGGMGYESLSVPSFDPTNCIGWEAGSPDITQVHNLIVTNFLTSSWEQDNSPLYYDSTRTPSSVELGLEINSVDLVQQYNIGGASSEYEFSISSPYLRQYGLGYTPRSRYIVVSKDTRIQTVLKEDRKITV